MTTTITTLDKAALKALGPDVVSYLKAYAETRGLTVAYAGGSYAGGFADLKIRLSVQRADGTVETPHTSLFRKYATAVGLEESDLGRTYGGHTITGMTSGLRVIFHKGNPAKLFTGNAEAFIALKKRAA